MSCRFKEINIEFTRPSRTPEDQCPPVQGLPWVGAGMCDWLPIFETTIFV